MFERRAEERIQHYCYLIKPDHLHTMKDLLYYDRAAKRGIQEAQKIIKDLEEYRMQLAERSQTLLTAKYSRVLSLVRRAEWKGNKYYDVAITRHYEDDSIEPQAELKETYRGAERHKAFARFAQLQKENPGIKTEKDIAKGRWEQSR